MPDAFLMAFSHMEETTMAVIRISKTKGFTVMSNYHLRDKNLTLKAKGLLSMMLSLPDGWHYSVRGLASICKEGVSSISATIRELDDCGYIRRHQPIVDGKFQEIEYIIYETPQAKTADAASNTTGDSDENAGGNHPDNPGPDDAEPCPDSAHSDFPYPGNPCTENPHTENSHTENPHTGNTGTENSHAYKRKKQSKTEKSNTDGTKHPSINQRAAQPEMNDGADAAQNALLEQMGAVRMADEFARYREYVKESIEFDRLCERYERDTLEGIVEIMVETLCSKAPYTRIGGQNFPTEVVKSRLMKLDSDHIEYVMTALSMNTTKIRNLKAYLLTTLYNSYTTINPFYDNWVQSDFPEYAQPR